MMGLLDPTDDPRTMGLLSLGMGLLGSKGSFGNALSQAGPQALQAMQVVKEREARKKQQEQAQQAQQLQMDRAYQLQQLQMQQAQMQMAEQQRQQALMQGRQTAFKGAFVPGMPGVGSPNGDMTGDFTAPGTAPSLNMGKYLQALVQGGDVEGAMPIYQSMQKDTKPIALSEGGELRLPDGTLVARNAKDTTDKMDPLQRLIALRDALPVGHPNRKLYESAITKASTHAPAASAVSYGSPVPIMMPDGSIGYAQPGNKAGAAPQVMAGPDGKPLVKPPGAEKDPTEGERKAATLLQRLRGSQAQLSSALTNSPDAAKPSAVVEAARRYAGDAPANVITPAARQQVEAAQLDILDAALTLGTGAAYTREQLEGYRRSYFPQIGDDPPTVRDKQARLKNVIEAAEIAAGRAAKNVPAFPATNGGAFDPEKERRYQEWKRKQGQ